MLPWLRTTIRKRAVFVILADMSLIIGSDQHKEIERIHETKRVAYYIKTIFGDSKLDKEEQRKFVQNGVEEAKNYSILLDENIERYLKLRNEFANYFKNNAVLEELLSTTVNEYVKIERLYIYLHSAKSLENKKGD